MIFFSPSFLLSSQNVFYQQSKVRRVLKAYPWARIAKTRRAEKENFQSQTDILKYPEEKFEVLFFWLPFREDFFPIFLTSKIC